MQLRDAIDRERQYLLQKMCDEMERLDPKAKISTAELELLRKDPGNLYMLGYGNATIKH